MIYSNPAHLLHVFPSFTVGGSQKRFAQILNGLPDRFRHTVLTLDGTSDMANHLPASAAIRVKLPAVGKSSGPGTWLACAQVLRRVRPDLLVTYNWGSMDWCIANLWLRCRHVHFEDGFGPEEGTGQLPRRVWTRRFVLARPECRVVVPSRALQRVASDVWRLPAANVKYIPNGVDCRKFGRGTRGKEGGPLVIGTIATLRQEKNLGRLIELFSSLARDHGDESLELTIVGDGPERKKLEAAASRHSGHIQFTGACSAPEKLLAGFDIFALTSDTEQMPLSILEAMASGLPIVSFAVGDVPEMVAPENRAFASIPLSDTAGFVAALRALAGSRSLRRQLGAANRAWALTHYDQAQMLSNYAALFD